jgi:hypothetical protein
LYEQFGRIGGKSNTVGKSDSGFRNDCARVGFVSVITGNVGSILNITD